MRRGYRGGLVRAYRSFSTEAPKKAEEELGGGWRKDLKRFGKYLAVIAPVLLGVAVTTVVVNNKSVKDGIEYVFPSYIDLVRKHVGFGEEDLEGVESRRIRDETVASTLDVTVTIRHRNGSQVEILHFGGLKGLMLCSELMDMVRNKLASGSESGSGSDRGQVADWESFLKNVDISFEFSDSEDPIMGEGNDNAADPYSTKALMHRERKELTAKLGEIQTSKGIAEAFNASIWMESSLPSMRDIRKKQRQLLDPMSLSGAGAGSESSLIENCRHILHVQFCNKVEHMQEGLLAYKALTRHDSILHALRSHYNSRGKYVENAQSELSKRSAADINASREKAQAAERVKELESRVKRLNNELEMGTRPIDDVLGDLSKTKAEITRLKRTYLNTLYFF